MRSPLTVLYRSFIKATIGVKTMSDNLPAGSSEWPESLDAVVAAPEHHRVLLENDAVRVLETLVAPGETVRMHTHRWPAAFYFVGVSDVVRCGPGGEVQVDTRKLSTRMQAGQAAWSPPLGPHTLENVGETPVHVISVEVKTQSAP
jgi:quercetin dioxygenase-like cupin family protein